MFRKLRTGRVMALAMALTSASSFSQQTPAAPSPGTEHEFPVILREKVVAGATPVGTKVQAKLVSATLVEGVVIPRGATFSGEISESVAKSATEPSRLAIRMDSAQWKNGSSPIKVYLTAWYYPVAAMPSQDLSYQPPDAEQSKRNWNGAGGLPDPNNPAVHPFPSGNTDASAKGNPSASPSSSISPHRVLMKDVESAQNSNGSVTLISARSNIKLDKLTTYVLATGDLMPKR
jgi:hypothetical protein